VTTSPNAVILSILRAGDHYLDIGANEGNMVFLASSAVGSQGKVYAFEPLESLFRQLIITCSRYGLCNTELFNAAVGSTEGVVDFFENLESPSSSSLSARWSGGVKRSTSITTLDSWSKEHSIQRLDLIKIDVEGAEYQVFQGARNLIEVTRPALLFEIREAEKRNSGFGYTTQEVMDFLSSMGYSAFLVLRRGGLVPIGDSREITATDADLLALQAGCRTLSALRISHSH